MGNATATSQTSSAGQEWRRRHHEIELLMSIPGVGIRTSEAFVAYVDDIRRFSKISQVGDYFGMVPREDSSSTDDQ